MDDQLVALSASGSHKPLWFKLRQAAEMAAVNRRHMLQDLTPGREGWLRL